MNSKALKFCFIIQLTIECIFISDGLFVGVGQYPDHLKYDVNHELCGLRYSQNPIYLTFDKKCFLNSYPDKTVSDIYRKEMKGKGNKVSSRIFHGESAVYGEAPYTVQLSFRRANVFKGLCTGALVTFEWVLTAAHCLDLLYNDTGLKLFLIAGDIHLTDSEEIVADSSKLFRHPQYIQGELDKARHDIGLVKAKFPFSRFKTYKNFYLINTICLPMPNQENHVQDLATFYGWGSVDDKHQRIWYLRKAETRLEPSSQCVNFLFDLCSHFQPGDLRPRLCSGDSGGPLVQFVDKYKSRSIHVGITKGFEPTGIGCNANQTDNYWVSVSQHIDWILKTIEKN